MNDEHKRSLSSRIGLTRALLNDNRRLKDSLMAKWTDRPVRASKGLVVLTGTTDSRESLRDTRIRSFDRSPADFVPLLFQQALTLGSDCKRLPLRNLLMSSLDRGSWN
jgi:hypothetical protein